MHRRVADVVVVSGGVADDVRVGVRESHGGIVEARQHRLEVVGLPLVVGVELRDQRGAGAAQRRVAGSPCPDVPAPAHDPKSRVAHVHEHLVRRDGRRVVDHDDLQVAHRLGERRLHRAPDGALGVVGGHHHRRPRLHGRHAARSSSRSARSATSRAIARADVAAGEGRCGRAARARCARRRSRPAASRRGPAPGRARRPGPRARRLGAGRARSGPPRRPASGG